MSSGSHSHSHHSSVSNDSSLREEVTSLKHLYIQEKKAKDSTSRFKAEMRQKRLRKKIFEKVFLFITCLIAVIILCGIFFAYCIDK